MDYNKFDLVTRCRAVFVCSILMLDPFFYDDGNTFFEELYDYTEAKKEESNYRRRDLSLLLHYIRIGKYKQVYDNEKTIIDLCNLIMDVNSNEKYVKLLDTLTPKQVDAVSNMVPEFMSHVNSNRNQVIHILTPQ